MHDPTDAYLSTSAQSEEHPPSTTPTATDVKQIMRDQNVKLGIGATVLMVVLVGVAWLTASSRAASRDSNNATQIQLASQGRNACITERRNAQADALGRISISANEAEVAGLVNRDREEALRQLDIFQEAVRDWQKATDALAPDILNLPTDEGGCGPPILTLSDLGR
jgi:hypothetical protein